MKAKIRVDDELLDEIEVKNGLQQGCTMAPTLFNLYVCMVVESWMPKMRDIDGVGMYVTFYKLDQQLFRRYTRNARDVLYKCKFADDVALLVTTRTAAEAAITAYSSEARKFGLMVSTPKMKFLLWVMERRRKSCCQCPSMVVPLSA